jgi:hypothetical protein
VKCARGARTPAQPQHTPRPAVGLAAPSLCCVAIGIALVGTTTLQAVQIVSSAARPSQTPVALQTSQTVLSSLETGLAQGICDWISSAFGLISTFLLHMHVCIYVSRNIICKTLAIFRSINMT